MILLQRQDPEGQTVKLIACETHAKQVLQRWKMIGHTNIEFAQNQPGDCHVCPPKPVTA